ncbi:MAG TPA: DISARM system phospholipase D-like protein DrmC [Edaphobacter sp.]|jgi:phosphatidylserine/phosphatidylglycerophosphate/cardiolipin synthase-like enzyme|nr:DISARM system phospholipase D-like protein DrmC [Edaphobacter sp.]
MIPAEACLRLAEELPVSLLESLIAQLRGSSVLVIPNPVYQARVDHFLERWHENRVDLAPMLEVALAARRLAPTTELVWTGPPNILVPLRRTEQVLFDLIGGAEEGLTLTSFGVFQIPRLVDELEAALERRVALRVVLGDRELHSYQEIERQRLQLGSKVVDRALLLHWPVTRRARDEKGRAGLMHVKAAVADSRLAFLTSANLTEAALERNMELGVLIRGGTIPSAIDRLIDTLVESGELCRL